MVDKITLEWKPSYLLSIHLFDSIDKNESFKKFRSASSSYISNKYVRRYIYSKYNSKCFICSSIDDLQIDHKVSVKNCFVSNRILFCNSISNLQLLCKKCHFKKSDNE